MLEDFQNNKSPGNDGIPVEFYKKFWSVISEPFTKCVNECFETGEMSRSQKQAVITLIEKKGKDRLLLENWRPISLVNVDAKIMSKVIATRIKNVLPNIIHHNQTGYVKDRYIGETVRSVFDIMDLTLKENVPGLLIFIDFQKPFDSLEWNFLVSCLEAFNFGPDFIRWVKTFYKNIQSCVINNGLMSNYFTLERGVRQGDPLSPYLFVVAIESLAIAIRKNPAIKGITIGNEETKLLQYADDMTAVLSDINSAQALFDLLEVFKKPSGLRINTTKTEGMWIGSSRENKAKPFGIKWPNEPIKVLGVHYTYDLKLLHEKNFIERLDSVKKLINIWSSRGLSIYGKVMIIKSLIIPKLVYISSLLPTPKEIIKELNQLLFKFLWKGTDKVTRLSAINEYENGGLKMIDLESMIQSLRLAWIKRIFGANDGTWKSYLRYLLNRFGGLFLFHCNYDVKDIPITSQFYSELLKWWSDFREKFDTERDQQNIVWNNKEIRINNKPVFYKNFFESGIIYVNDLLFHLNNTDSFNIISKTISRTNVLIWAGLRHSVPSHLKTTNCTSSTTPLSFRIDNKDFDALKKKSKDYYLLIKSRKAHFPTNSQFLKQDFNLTDDQLKEVFILPHNLAFEPYVKAFQYKILNSILYTTINGCQSQAMPVTFGVPQGSVLGPTLFSLFCNDLPDITEGIDGDPQLHMYADDTTVYVSAPTFDLVASKLNEVLARLYTWCCENCLTPHPTKTEYMLLSGRGQLTGPKQAIKMGDYVIEEVVSTRCLGVQIDNALKWDHHVSELAKSFTQKLNLLKSLYFLPRQARTDFYFGVILPSVTYGMLVWGSCGQTFFSNLESIHVRAAKIIFNLDWCTPSKEVLTAAKWNTLETMYEKRLLILAHRAYYHFLPCPMNCLFVKYVSSYDLRRKMTFKLPRPRTDMIKKSCSYKSIIRWNALENQMRSICDIDAFKKSLKCIF